MAVQIVTACAGFLPAVLWMDLIFDTQISRRAYSRATTTSRPMSALIAMVMGILLVALAVEAFLGSRPGWLMAVSRSWPAAEQTRLARAILRDHVVCLVGIGGFLVLWLAAG